MQQTGSIEETAARTGPLRQAGAGLFRHAVRACAGFAAATRGVAGVEFALVGGLAIYLIIETMQTGVYFYYSASLDRATTKAARQILTGAVSSQGLSAAQFRSQILCPLLPSVMSCANVITNINTVPEALAPNGFYTFLNADQSGVVAPTMSNSNTSFCIGTTGSYVYIQVYYAMPAISPTWRTIGATSWGGNQVHFVSAYAAFKNEPFQGGSQGSC